MKVFYHKNCADGITAAAVAEYWFRQAGFNKPRKFIPVQYEERFPIEEVEPNENVVIVDFSIDPQEMKDLLKITKKVKWIDHHKSAIDKYDKFKDTEKIEGIRSVDRSGAYLMWKFLAPTHEPPMIVKYIDDHDRFVHQYEESHAVRSGVMALSQMDPVADQDELWQPLMENDQDMLNQVIDVGNILETNADNYRRDAKGYKLEFEGLTFLVMNKMGNSLNFKYIDDGTCDGLMTWMFDGEGYVYRMYHSRRGKRENVDLSEIAVKYGGGGHPGACGFYSKEFVADPRK